MPRSVPALINPSVLVWARQLLRYDIDNASDKIGVKPNVLNEWETGSSLPSISQLRTIARTYNRPIANFYLPTPPPSKMPKVKDHRLLPEGGVGYYTPELMKEFLNASSRREIMIEMHDNIVMRPKN
ncbi:MAG TPA: XRE family transcriptional regulator [Bacteroidetes bacterium]|nr:XRE family transcriptional regulator [Bacteroidota bacterium]